MISVIIPTYNRAHLISETLNSILAQTYENWECIIVDDNSKDNTDLVVKEYIEKDKRFSYYKKPIQLPKGPSASRNYGLTKATGEYINWFDSDDLMRENFLEKRFELFKKNKKLDIVFCAYSYFNEMGVQNRIGNHKFSGDILKDFVEGKIIFGPPSYLIKKKILKGISYDENLLRTEDVDFFLKLFTSIQDLKIAHVSRSLFKVRKHTSNISSTDDKSGARLDSTFIVHKRLLDYFYRIKYDYAISVFFEKCMIDLEKLLFNGNYKKVFFNIYNFEYINIQSKFYMFICAITQVLFGRGSYQFRIIKLKT